MIELNKWSGSFNEPTHQYFREDGKELSGVTGMLKKMLFNEEYKGVSESVLANAAERGSLIHKRIELYDAMGVGTDMPEVMNYANLKKEFGLECIASEYLVSDDENYASAIDKVFHKAETPEDEVVLGDIKTTYQFNREYVSWQLSVYAYFFERLNPRLKVTTLIGLWIREDKRRGSIAKVIEVERKSVEIIEELIKCSVEGRPFTLERVPSFISENIDKLIFLNERINALTEEKKAIVAEIMQNMQNKDMTKVDTGVILFTRKAAATRTTFDTTRFKAEHADMYKEYTKESVGEETLQLKFRE